jgi:hypothetical protein
MKKTTITILALVLIALASRYHQQREINRCISKQKAMTEEQFYSLMDRIEQDHPNYVLDVLSETDQYQDIIENL